MYRRLLKVIGWWRVMFAREGIGWVFRADGDVETFIEDDLRTGIFGTFLPFSLGGIAGRERARRTRRNGRERGPEELESVISESTLAAATTDHTHRRVAKRKKQKIARGGKRDGEKERQRGRIEMQKEGRRDDVGDKERSRRKRKRQAIVRDCCVVLNLVPSFLPTLPWTRRPIGIMMKKSLLCNTK